jgi:hypothetical protein
MVLSTVLLMVIALTKRLLWSEYLGYLLATFFISLFPLAFYLFGFASLIWTGITAMLTSLLTIIGMFIFADKLFKEEMKKRFHF